MKRLLFLLPLICHWELSAQSVTIALSSDSLYAGQPFEYRVSVQTGSIYKNVIPPDSALWGNFLEYRGFRRVSSVPGTDSLIISLQFFGTKDTLIAPARFTLVGDDTLRLMSVAMPIYFKSLLPSEQAELEPLKPIYDFARNWWWLIFLLLVLCAIAYGLVRRYRNRTVEQPVQTVVVEKSPFVSPLDILNGELERLKRQDLIHRNEVKVYYSELGDILRRYIEDAHGIPAFESTTRDLRAAFKKRGLHSELAQPCLYVLDEADMVKFARFKPTAVAADLCHKQARMFADAAARLDLLRIQMLQQQHEKPDDLS